MKALPSFRRALGYVWPQKRLLALMCLAVLGVSVFYTVSISSMLPLLQVMFYDNQTLPGWIYKAGADHRLGARIRPENPAVKKSVVSRADSHAAGLYLMEIRVGPLADAGVSGGDTIVSINGKSGTVTQMMRQVLELPDDKPAQLVIQRERGGQESVAVVPGNGRWYTPVALRVAQMLPQGTDVESRFATLKWVIIGLVVVVMLGGVCRFFHEYIVGVLTERAMLRLRSQAYAHVVRLPMSWFAQQQAGDTISRFARDTAVVEFGFKVLFEKLLTDPLKALGVLIFSLAIDWRLMILVLVVLPGAGAAIAVLGTQVKRAQKRSLQAWGQLLELLEERMAGIKILKSVHAERREALTFFRKARRLLAQQIKIARADAATGPLLEALGAIAVGSFVLYGGWRVFEGRLSAPAFFTEAACLGAMLAPIRRLASANNRLQAAESAAGRFFEVIDLQPESDSRDCVELPALRRNVQFDRVTFSYNGADKPALQDVSLCIESGETIAIVGPNGSGKTTLSSLLLRYFTPDSGTIQLDGQDIGRASLGSLRKQIGLVTQDTVIFTDTIHNNIAYSDPKATRQRVEAAAKAAHADEFIRAVRIEQKKGKELVGYDAIVSGRTLSGGQKQRIAIARAVLSNPPILIFDEATSQVDAESEKKIQEALAELTRGRTTIIIAHRLSTVISADRIVVMDKGRIVATGKHEQLHKTCELYRAFCDAQLTKNDNGNNKDNNNNNNNDNNS